MPREVNHSINSSVAERQSLVSIPIPKSIQSGSIEKSPLKLSGENDTVYETVVHKPSPSLSTKKAAQSQHQICSDRQLRVNLVRLKFPKPKVDITVEKVVNGSDYVTSTEMATATPQPQPELGVKNDVVEVVDITDDPNEPTPMNGDSEEILVSVNADTVLAMEEEDAVASQGDINFSSSADADTNLDTSSTMALPKKPAKRKSVDSIPFFSPQTCLVCNQSFEKHEYLAHIRQHQTFKCNHCIKEFATYAKLKKHCLRLVRNRAVSITGTASNVPQRLTTQGLGVGQMQQVPPTCTWTPMLMNTSHVGVASTGYDVDNGENNNFYPLHFMNNFFETDDDQLNNNVDTPAQYGGHFNGRPPPPPFNFNTRTNMFRQPPPQPDSTPVHTQMELEFTSYKDLLTPLSKIKNFALEHGDGTLLFTVHELEKHVMTKVIKTSQQ